MVDRFLNMALFGGEPILYFLITLSFVSIAVIIERSIVYLRNRVNLPDLTATIVHKLNEDDIEGACQAIQAIRAAEARVVGEGLRNFDQGPLVVGELMESMRTRQHQYLDRRLIILGTIGSNAPFIGLLGTVLGIIKAFNDLAYAGKAGPSVVMAGISEALVATAVGLLVAIPAVFFFNYFKNCQKTIMENIDQLKNTLLAFLGAHQTKDIRDISSKSPSLSEIM